MKSGNNRLSQETCVSILLAEYRALYDLALFRLTSLDRRVPLTGSALAAALGATLVLPVAAKHFILIAQPLALVWFLRTTINHARSFEDALRRIEEIEGHFNRAARRELVVFQSRHPSRGRAIGGRTGYETIIAVLTACGLILVGCAWLTMILPPTHPPVRYALLCYFTFIGLYLASIAVKVCRYSYRKTPLPQCPDQSSANRPGCGSDPSTNCTGGPAST